MTSRQREIYNYVVEYIQQHNYAPSVREIAKATRCSATMTHGVLRELEEAGSIKRIGPRAIKILDKGE